MYLACLNLQVLINFPALANADDDDHDFFGILMKYHAATAHPQPEIIIFSLQQLQVLTDIVAKLRRWVWIQGRPRRPGRKILFGA